MRVLVLNAGSSSVKYALIDPGTAACDFEGKIERVGDALSHEQAFAQILERCGAVAIDAVGHRVVHGGSEFHQASVIDDRVEAAIEACVPLAPLHNPHNLAGIRAARRALGAIPHVAVFDTAFHAQAAAARAHLRHRSRARRARGHPALRLSRHVARIRRGPRGRRARAQPCRAAHRHAAPGQRRERMRGRVRPLHRDEHGNDAARGAGDGDARRRPRPGRDSRAGAQRHERRRSRCLAQSAQRPCRAFRARQRPARHRAARRGRRRPGAAGDPGVRAPRAQVRRRVCGGHGRRRRGRPHGRHRRERRRDAPAHPAAVRPSRARGGRGPQFRRPGRCGEPGRAHQRRAEPRRGARRADQRGARHCPADRARGARALSGEGNHGDPDRGQRAALPSVRGVVRGAVRPGAPADPLARHLAAEAVRLRGEGQSDRAARPHRRRAPARSAARQGPGRDLAHRRVQARRRRAGARLGQDRGLGADHPRRPGGHAAPARGPDLREAAHPHDAGGRRALRRPGRG